MMNDDYQSWPIILKSIIYAYANQLKAAVFFPALIDDLTVALDMNLNQNTSKAFELMKIIGKIINNDNETMERK